MEKRNFLLCKAKDVESSHFHECWTYDENVQLNTTITSNDEVVRVCMRASIITGSKTEAFPGDDDPDPEVENCY